MLSDIEKVLFPESAIHARLDEMAGELTREYEGCHVTFVGILNGSCLFLADLLRRIPLPLKVDCLSVASYHGETNSSGTVQFRQSNLPDVSGRHVLLLDDILDTGRTLAAVKRRFVEDGSAIDVKTCVLLRKHVPREEDVTADYIGFEIPNEFVVGYGLDFMGLYRNLPFIGVLNEQAIARNGRMDV